MRTVVAVCVVLLPLAGCFSEHTTTIEVDPSAVCSISISELAKAGAYVPIRGYDFLVDTLRVKAGTRVTWVNCESPPADPHTSTSDAGVWNSPFIAVGQTYSRVFDTRGTFRYHCIPHPTMRAMVIVE